MLLDESGSVGRCDVGDPIEASKSPRQDGWNGEKGYWMGEMGSIGRHGNWIGQSGHVVGQTVKSGQLVKSSQIWMGPILDGSLR